MQVVILAGGLGTRLSEEKLVKPKPMVEVGGKPILWHIMQIYSAYGFDEFIICCGYKGYLIKEYFANYYIHSSDVTIDLSQGGDIQIHRVNSEPWKVTLVDTGLESQTGGRIGRVKEYINQDHFFMTYGDGVSDVNLQTLLNFHKQQNKLITLTAVQPPGRYGSLDLNGDMVCRFVEKPQGDKSWISGGFFVVNSKVVEAIDNDLCVWETDILEKYASRNQVSAYKHEGFWQPMDTLRDKNRLEELWQSGNAPWRIQS